MSLPTIHGFDIRREIGAGGMGVVYLAQQITLERMVALKVLHQHLARDEELKQRFLNEARLMARLVHPAIVQLFDFVRSDGLLVLVMEYVNGRPLDLMIGHEVGPIPFERALFLFSQVLEGVEYAHGNGVIHRDLKPSNILVTGDNRTKIADFGIAKIAGASNVTRSGTRMGTVHYMPPEQIQCLDTGELSDIYSLGITLYEMLAGRLPFEDETSEYRMMNSIVKGELPDPREFYPEIPGWLVKVVRKASSREPANRYQSCREFLEALTQFQRETKSARRTSSGLTGRIAAITTRIKSGKKQEPETPEPVPTDPVQARQTVLYTPEEAAEAMEDPLPFALSNSEPDPGPVFLKDYLQPGENPVMDQETEEPENFEELSGAEEQEQSSQIIPVKIDPSGKPNNRKWLKMIALLPAVFVIFIGAKIIFPESETASVSGNTRGNSALIQFLLSSPQNPELVVQSQFSVPFIINGDSAGILLSAALSPHDSIALLLDDDIMIFTRDGRLLEVLEKPWADEVPIDVAFLEDGRLLAGFNNRGIAVYSNDMTLSGTILDFEMINRNPQPPRTLAVSGTALAGPQSFLLSPDSCGVRVRSWILAGLEFSSSSEPVWTVSTTLDGRYKMMAQPPLVALSGDGYTAVVDNKPGNVRIVIYEAGGNEYSGIDLAPGRLWLRSQSEFDVLQRRLQLILNSEDTGWQPDGNRSSVLAMGFDSIGRLWVQQPDSVPRFSVFDISGEELFSVNAPLDETGYGVWQSRISDQGIVCWYADPTGVSNSVVLLELQNDTSLPEQLRFQAPSVIMMWLKLTLTNN